MQRLNDIVGHSVEEIQITIDGGKVRAFAGETVLSVLFAIGKKAISKNDRGCVSGAYCGMGICHSCHVSIDGIEKKRACQIEVKQGMAITTKSNLSDAYRPIKKEDSFV